MANRDQVAEKRVVRDCEVLVGPYPRKCFEHALDGGIDLRGFQPSNLACSLHSKHSSCLTAMIPA